jgi:molecular chaperone DnaK
MAVIGIDLGTTYCAGGICVDGRPQPIMLEGEPTMPSVVGLQRNGKIAVGKTAKRNQARAPQNTIIEIKREMGKKTTVPLGDRQFTPQEISAMLLKKIKECAEAELGEEVTGVVITCPAYFKDPQRAATKEAGQIAGLNVLKIINEPTAAAYAYGVVHDTGEAENLFIVYDLGGGTFDVTVIQMVGQMLEVMGTGGDPNLGGGDFDDRIVGWMIEHLQKSHPGYMATMTDEKRAALRLRLKSYAEEGKIKLCESRDAEPAYQFQIPSVDIFEGKPIAFDETLTMKQFEELIGDLLTNSLKWIDVAMEVPRKTHQFTEDHVTAVLLVGGSTRVPMVRRLLEERFGRERVRGRECGINPDEIVALGAAIAASDENPEGGEVAAKTLVDVTGHTLSVAAIDAQTGREVLCPIIPKETQIPCGGVHEFASMGNFQQVCRVRVFQGEGRAIDPKQVTMIGEFEIIIPRVRESLPLRIGLDLDGNGLLVAHATEGMNGQRVECRINYDDSAQLSPEELEKKRKALDATLDAVLRQAANPLDGRPAAAAAGANPWAPPPPPPTDAAWSGPAAGAPMPTPAAPVDPTALMNPIMRNLYNKAIRCFDRVPADRQAALVRLVSDIENVARSGDQARLMAFFPQLQKLLEGVD